MGPPGGVTTPPMSEPLMSATRIQVQPVQIERGPRQHVQLVDVDRFGIAGRRAGIMGLVDQLTLPG